MCRWQETFDTASIRKSFSKLRFQNPELKESAETVMMSAEEETGGGMALLYKKLQEVCASCGDSTTALLGLTCAGDR